MKKSEFLGWASRFILCDLIKKTDKIQNTPAKIVAFCIA